MNSNGRQLRFDFIDGVSNPSEAGGELDTHRRRIAGHLTVRLPEPVDVVFTNNRSTMVSFKRGSGRLTVRLHRLFRRADETILDALALYIGKKDKHASVALDEFIRVHKDEISPARRDSKTRLTPEGKYYNLEEVLSRLNRTYFDNRVDVAIGWGRAPAKRRKKRTRSVSRALATYSFDDKSIRVSPVLDAPDVPDFIVDWVVYHEMLHHIIPIEEARGKRKFHTDRFKNLEKAFARYEEAKRWERENIERLLF